MTGNVAATPTNPANAVMQCGARTGPVWKLGGEVCVCVEPAGHVDRKDGTFGADHLCSCGAWFVDEVAR